MARDKKAADRVRAMFSGDRLPQQNEILDYALTQGLMGKAAKASTDTGASGPALPDQRADVKK